MKQSKSEKSALNNLWYSKRSQKYNLLYWSSAVLPTKAKLGTIESDTFGDYGRFAKEPFRASKLAIIINLPLKSSILDVGGGNLLAASYFSNRGYVVDVIDKITSPYLTLDLIKKSGVRTHYNSFFEDLNINNKYDLIWMSHVLEHVENIGLFLKKILENLSSDGHLAIAVPPRKPFIVSGHINMFNPGLLVYRLVLAGIDCSEAKVFQYDNNICLLVKNNSITLPEINFDFGDFDLIKKYFPGKFGEGFNGDFMNINLTDKELVDIYGKNLFDLLKKHG